VNAAAPAITGTALEGLARHYVSVMTMIQRLARRYDAAALQQMIYLPRLSSDADAAALTAWSDALAESLRHEVNGSGIRYRLAVTRDVDGQPAIEINRGQHGNEEQRVVPMAFFAGAEYQRLVAFGAELSGLIGDGAFVLRGEQQQPVHSFREAMEWLMAEARKGLGIQRYKGLGEMNPDQLWDTTVNPETRRLMRVQIEDAVSADEIFTTLMGDQVEPRREFIERNALTVENLDV
jgi:DNA gyrase subunit B